MAAGSIALFLKDSLLISTLVFVSYIFFQNGFGRSYLFREDQYLPSFFLFQFFMLLGTSFQFQLLGGLYLCLVPTMAGLYFLQYKDRNNTQVFKAKSVALMVITCLSYFVVNYFLETAFIE